MFFSESLGRHWPCHSLSGQQFKSWDSIYSKYSSGDFLERIPRSDISGSKAARKLSRWLSFGIGTRPRVQRVLRGAAMERDAIQKLLVALRGGFFLSMLKGFCKVWSPLRGGAVVLHGWCAPYLCVVSSGERQVNEWSFLFFTILLE